jgi:acetylornithine deacetylase/succinyl-diaminopimelate desuccinylase-like protein
MSRAAEVRGAVDREIESGFDRSREELFELLRIPSVSADPERREDVRRAARWLRDTLARIGLEASLQETSGHPIVLGEWRRAEPEAPTVLIYGHYDVQPADPIEGWTSPPFEPSLRDGRIYGRGAVDNKGQIYAHLKAIEAHLRATRGLPVNVVVMIEGEEETGSTGLLAFVASHAERLAAAAVVISDSTMWAEDQPSIDLSLRGLLAFEIEVAGPSRDLHSGRYGGAVVNPAAALARVIASFHDEGWRVAIPGFYDAVDPSLAERERFRSLHFDEDKLGAETGAPVLAGEAGQSTLERIWLRPTVEINGLDAGYRGIGIKTVLPGTAKAKVSCRLVPNQDPSEIARLVDEHLRRVAPVGVRLSTRFYPPEPWWRGRPDGPVYQAATRAIRRVYGRAPVYAGSGGTIPIVAGLAKTLGAPVLLLGFGLPGSNAHAPDEWLSLRSFEQGIRTSAALLTELSNLGAGD